MPSLTATIKFVNQPAPGKKNGSLKLQDDTYLGVRPEMLPIFQPGRSYVIEYEEHEYRGQMYKTVKSGRPVEQTNGSAAPQVPVRASWSPKDSEHAFVTKILGDAVRSGAVPFSTEALTAAVRCLRTVHKQGFAATVGQQRDDDMGDHIDF